MRFTSRAVTSVAAIALTCVVTAAAYFYRRRKVEINDVMIFCKLQLNAFSYYDKLLSFIDSAEKSIQVCMPSIHNIAIQGRLLDVMERKNIKVQIIIDGMGYNDSTSTFLKELIEAGAEIKQTNRREKYYKIHHKFCLVDEQVLMTGTLDWGNDKSCDNWNYVYITSKPQLVLPVVNEFRKIWCDKSTISVTQEYIPEPENEIDDAYSGEVERDTGIADEERIPENFAHLAHHFLIMDIEDYRAMQPMLRRQRIPDFPNLDDDN